jgi:hypothetical protein
MFALCTRFGIPALFFTVTPEDVFVAIFESRSCGLVKVHHFMMCGKWSPVSFKMCMKYDVLQHVPRLCAIDFRNVLKLVVHYVLGWNSETKTSEYGPFGKIQAFYGAVEEQASKKSTPCSFHCVVS